MHRSGSAQKLLTYLAGRAHAGQYFNLVLVTVVVVPFVRFVRQ